METVARRHRRQGSRRDPSIDAAVLAATRRLLIDRGYAATTIDLIATTAQVSRPAVYRRWSSKAQLVHEALFPDLGPEPPADDFVAEITRLCRGALACTETRPCARHFPVCSTIYGRTAGCAACSATAWRPPRAVSSPKGWAGRRRRHRAPGDRRRHRHGRHRRRRLVRGLRAHVKDVDTAATELSELVLRGVLV